MTLKESYQNAYARKNKAVSASLKTKKATLSAEKKRLKEQGEETLRAAYAEHMRASAAAAQQNRAQGRFGGAAENQKAGLEAAHSQKRAALQKETGEKVAALDEQIASATASADKQIADNNTALQQKIDNLAIKEAEAAAKAKKTSTKSGSSSSSSSSSSASGKVSKSQAITLMKMGIYDPAFAGILGISDSEVRDYIKNAGKKKTDEPAADTAPQGSTRLPGTYKPPLK